MKKIKFYTERVKERERKQTEIDQIEFEQSAAGKQLAEMQRLRKEIAQYHTEAIAKQESQQDDAHFQAAVNRKKNFRFAGTQLLL